MPYVSRSASTTLGASPYGIPAAFNGQPRQRAPQRSVAVRAPRAPSVQVAPNIRRVVVNGVPVYSGLGDALGFSLSSIVKGVGNVVKKVASPVTSVVKKVAAPAVNAAINFIPGGGFIKSAVSAGYGIVKNVITGSKAPEAARIASSTAQAAAVEQRPDLVTRIASSITSAGTAVRGVLDRAGGVAQGIANTAQGAANSLSQAGGAAEGAAYGAVTGAAAGAQGAAAQDFMSRYQTPLLIGLAAIVLPRLLERGRR